MSIGILITNYNTWPLTSQSIENCFQYSDSPIDKFVVVDDCSTEPFENQFGEKITLVRNEKNAGLIQSLNKGLKMLDTDLIVIFDSDAWPLENFTTKVQEYFKANPKVGIAAFETVDGSGKPSASYEAEPVAISLILGQKLYQMYQQRFQKNPKAITVYTCAMVIRKEVIEQIGYFDENFDWLELDHDICMRASRKGWDIGVMPLRAFHKGSGTPQKVGHRVIRFYKNRWYLLRKFEKVRFVYLSSLLISLRVSFEYCFLFLLGRFYYNDKKVLTDKLYSRKEVLKYFMRFQH